MYEYAIKINRSNLFKINISQFSMLFYIASICFLNGTVIFYIASAFFVLIQITLMIMKRRCYFGLPAIFYIIFLFYHILLIGFGTALYKSYASGRIFIMCLNFIIGICILNHLLYEYNIKIFINRFITLNLIFVTYILIRSWGYIFSLRLGWDMKYPFGFEGEYNSNTIGLFCIFSILLCLNKFIEEKNTKELIYIAYFSLIALFTGSRKALICICLYFLCYSVFYTKRKRLRNIIICMMIFGILYFAIMNMNFLYNIIGFRIEDIFNSILTGSQFTETSAISRYNMIETAKSLFQKNPLFGYGIDSFRFMQGSYGTYCHNNYFEMLVGGGIVGAILYYLIYTVIFIKLFKLKKENLPYAKTMLIFMISLLILDYMLVSYLNRTIIMFLFMAQAIIINGKKANLYKGL